MSILASVVPVTSLVRAVSDLFQRRGGGGPSPAPGTDFGQLLSQSMESPGTTFLAARDADGNGLLNPVEFGGDANLFRALDRDGNGQLDLGELDRGFALQFARHQAASAAARVLEQNDVNGDGQLTALELGITEADMAPMDFNGDGLLNRAELMSAYVQQNRSRP